MSVPPDVMRVTLPVIDILEHLEVPYLITGSVALLAYGIQLLITDKDLMADLHTDHVMPLAHALAPEFSGTFSSFVYAGLYRTNLEVIHKSTGIKVNIFPTTRVSFDRSQLERRKTLIFPFDTGRQAFFITPEDLILSKLELSRIKKLEALIFDEINKCLKLE
jgi:hypothetical protein